MPTKKINRLVTTSTIVPDSRDKFSFLTTQQIEYKQLKIWEPIQNIPEREYPLSIERLPDALQWWSEARYWVVHKDSGLRIPGSFNEREARKIQEISKKWDWTIDTRDRKVACALNLLALAEGICSQSSAATAQKKKTLTDNQ